MDKVEITGVTNASLSRDKLALVTPLLDIKKYHPRGMVGISCLGVVCDWGARFHIFVNDTRAVAEWQGGCVDKI